MNISDYLCYQCHKIVLPKPGTRWVHKFGTLDIIRKQMGFECGLCKLVATQFWLSFDKEVQGILWSGILGVAIELSIRQNEPDRLYCQLTRETDGHAITVTLSISYPSSG